MGHRPLDPEIINRLKEKTGLSKTTIRKDISILRRNYGGLPINAVAQIYARTRRTSVLTKLTDEEKALLPNIDIDKPAKIPQKMRGFRRKKRIINFIKYDTDDPFIKSHIIETNKAYTFGCYTAAFILCRKIVENLLTDIVRHKYPPNKKENVELYYDTGRRRTKDFSEIISNLRARSNDFGPDRTLLERMLNRADQFKDDANNKTHSWYHIVRNKKELDDTQFEDIINMIIKIEENLSKKQ